MEHNPYTPPTTQDLEAQEITFLREVVPRPIGVWILLAVLVACIVFLGGGLAKFLWAVLSNMSEIRNLAGVAIVVAWRLALIAGLAVFSVGLYQAFRWSRWLGVAVILGFAAVSLLQPDTTYYANEARRTGGFIGRMIIFPLLVAWWAYAVGFSSKARRYFSKDSSK